MLAMMAAGVLIAGAAASAQDYGQEQGSVEYSQNQPQEVTGTVVSLTGDMLVIRSDAGQRTFIIDPESALPENLRINQKVDVTYHADPMNADQLIVSRVDVSAQSMAGEMESEGEPVEGAESVTGRTRLPQTASPLPLIALTGLASFGGFLVLKRRS
jgi:hypothetical protein